MRMSDVLYHATSIPAMQNSLCPSRSQALCAVSAGIELAHDDTGLVVNRLFDQSLVTYDCNYQNEQGYSIQFQRHLDEVCALCSSLLADEHGLIVDVGCGKGSFVEMARERGLNAIGYDYSYHGNKPYIRRSFFDVNSHDKGDLLTLRHVLEHIQSPWDFLARIALANDYKGYIYIEVPDLDWILANHAFFDLFHEHVNYFRSSDFLRCFGEGVVYLAKSFGGQYLSVVLDLAVIKAVYPISAGAVDSGLGAHFQRLKQYERSVYEKLSSSGRIVVWGAAAKGVVFSSKAPLHIRRKIEYAIDINPNKQGQFMPISGVEVLDPISGLAMLSTTTVVVIMNPNYEQEIRESLPHDQPCIVLH